MDRSDLAVHHLAEEWDTVCVLCSRYNHETGQTEMLRHKLGNSLAINKMLDDEVQEGLFSGGEWEEEEEV